MSFLGFDITTVPLATAIAASLIINSINSAQAVSIVDVQQSDASVGMAAFSQGDLAQSFISNFNNVSGAGIITDVATNFTISLYDALPNNSGNLLASANGSSGGGSFADIFFSNPVSVNPGSTLFLTFTGSNGVVQGSTNNPYLGGQVFANPGYQSFSQFDYAFRTFTDNKSTGPVAVPEPTNIIGTLVAGIFIIAMKKRALSKNTKKVSTT